MMKTPFRTVIILLAILLCGKANAQDAKPVNFFDQIKNHDLSTILTADSILSEDRESGRDKIERGEILGIIGDNYQRFFIHLISVIQNPENPYEYFVYGKTKVKENICSFQGTITVKRATIRQSEDIPAYQQGVAVCEVVLYEDQKQPSTGSIKGKLESNFLIDDKGRFRYDAIMLVADGFSNNQFTGTWTSYKTKASKKCHWGDYRIPDCGDLDIGAGEFSVNQKYSENGWASYTLEHMIPNTAIVKKKATNKQRSNRQWWE